MPSTWEACKISKQEVTMCVGDSLPKCMQAIDLITCCTAHHVLDIHYQEYGLKDAKTHWWTMVYSTIPMTIYTIFTYVWCIMSDEDCMSFLIFCNICLYNIYMVLYYSREMLPEINHYLLTYFKKKSCALHLCWFYLNHININPIQDFCIYTC